MERVRAEEWGPTSGAAALADLAPEAAALFARLCAARPIGSRRLTLVRRSCAAVHGLDPLDLTRLDDDDETAGRPGDDDAVVAFARQFSADVAGIGADLRERFVQACGPLTFETAQAIYLADLAPRARAALDLVVGGSDGWPPPVGASDGTDTWALIEEFIRVVHGLQRVDPVTSEVVRLRGARQHRCRLCQSLRSRPALLAGGDDDLWDAIDGTGAELAPGHRAALGLTDWMIWTPGRPDPAVASEVRSWFTPAQAIELVLDVMRNAANKIAVSLGADEAHVTDGVEVYEIDADGTTHLRPRAAERPGALSGARTPSAGRSPGSGDGPTAVVRHDGQGHRASS